MQSFVSGLQSQRVIEPLRLVGKSDCNDGKTFTLMSEQPDSSLERADKLIAGNGTLTSQANGSD